MALPHGILQRRGAATAKTAKRPRNCGRAPHRFQNGSRTVPEHRQRNRWQRHAKGRACRAANSSVGRLRSDREPTWQSAAAAARHIGSRTVSERVGPHRRHITMLGSTCHKQSPQLHARVMMNTTAHGVNPPRARQLGMQPRQRLQGNSSQPRLHPGWETLVGVGKKRGAKKAKKYPKFTASTSQSTNTHG